MPIAVLDSVHILSDFYDRYPRVGDRKGQFGSLGDNDNIYVILRYAF